MTQISDNFVRANGALGANWGPVIAAPLEDTSTLGGLLINNNGYGPINAGGGDGTSAWAGGGTFGNNQWAIATINSVAPNIATLSITSISFSGGNSTYTYTVTQGSVTTPISGGTLYVVVTGMQNAGNNGHFTATTFGAGTFTVANASGVTESGSTGVGVCPSDSGAGVSVRTQGTSAANLSEYFFHVGTNSFGGAGRIAFYELWKAVNGVGTILGNVGDTGMALINPTVGDTVGITAVGNTVAGFYNNVKVFQVTDASTPTGGVPGITSWSINGPNEYNWVLWNEAGFTPTGNNGTTLNNWLAGDTNFITTQLAADALTEGQIPKLTDSFTYANGDLHTDNPNWVYSGGSFQISSDKAFSSATGLAYRSDAVWPADQFSEVTAVVNASSGTQNCGPAVRIQTGTSSGYIIQYATNLFAISKQAAGVTTQLASSSSFPVTGNVIRLQVTGNSLTAFLNGVAVTSLTNIIDNTFATGNAGIFGAGNATQNGFSSWDGAGLTTPSQFTEQIGTFSSDTTAGEYAVGFASSGNALAYQNTVTWPANQYAQITISGASITGVQQYGAAVRVSPSQTTFYCFYPTSASQAVIQKVVNGAVGVVLNSIAYTFNQGDVFNLVAFGSLLVGSINGVNVLTAFDTSIATGNAGFFGQNTAGNPATPSGTFKNWSGGSVSNSTPIPPSSVYSQPDCRNFFIFPNGSVLVNGTKTYTVQTSDNAAIPPKDSRTAGAPAASNVAYPQNSRTPGTFGPGE